MEAGWIEGLQKNKLVIPPLQGKTHFLAPNRLLFHWKGAPPEASKEEAHSELKRQFEEARRRKSDLDLETIHDLLDTSRDYSLDEITRDFLEEPGDFREELALLFALRDDTLWFRHNRNLTYTPRTTSEVEQLEIQKARRQERLKNAERVQEWIHVLESDAVSEAFLEEEQVHEWLDLIEQLLVKGHESPQWKEYASLLGWGQIMSYSEERRLKQWLERAGRLMTPTRLYVLRANGRMEFSKEVETAAERLEPPAIISLTRVPDNLPTFTIDGEKTRDYDDALTVYGWNVNGIQLAVHITDLSQCLAPGSLLFREAERRISSLYTPESTYPMLPGRLSNGTFSLKSGEERAVLSFHFQLFCRGGWQLKEVVPGCIRVLENLSYQDAEERIRGRDEFWETLRVCCDALLQKREEDGALNLVRHEFDINVEDLKRIRIVPVDRNSPSNSIIEELAVLVNRETARLFQEREFPGIYRTQAPYELLKEVGEGKDVTLEDISIEAARLSTVPQPHAGLGCESYMQVTSPIRRFLDLVTQCQIRALLEKREPVFDPESLMRWAELIQTRQREYTRAERQVVHYWKSRYLQQHTGLVYSGRVRRQLPNQRTEIELTELNYLVPVNGFDKTEPGTEMLLLLKEVQLEPLRLDLRPIETGGNFQLHRFD